MSPPEDLGARILRNFLRPSGEARARALRPTQGQPNAWDVEATWERYAMEGYIPMDWLGSRDRVFLLPCYDCRQNSGFSQEPRYVPPARDDIRCRHCGDTGLLRSAFQPSSVDLAALLAADAEATANAEAFARQALSMVGVSSSHPIGWCGIHLSSRNTLLGSLGDASRISERLISKNFRATEKIRLTSEQIDDFGKRAPKHSVAGSIFLSTLFMLIRDHSVIPPGWPDAIEPLLEVWALGFGATIFAPRDGRGPLFSDVVLLAPIP